MTLSQLRQLYPRTHRLVSTLIADGRMHPRGLDGLSEHALRRIEGGATSRRDAVLLLVARAQQRGRG